MPFGEQLMGSVSRTLFATSAVVGAQATRAADFINATAGLTAEKSSETASSFIGSLLAKTNGTKFNIWATGAKTDPARLQNQMFAYTVTNQAVGTFTEVGLPFVMRRVEAFRSGSSSSSKTGSSSTAGPAGPTSGPSTSTVDGKKFNNGKRVVFEDEESGGRDEREFLARVRHEASLPPYTLFADYSEMVTQFGYVSLWSTIWPLASGEHSLSHFLRYS